MRVANERWLRARLLEAKMTQRDLAKILGVNPSAVCRLLKGERRMQIREAVVFAKATGARLEDVLRHVELPT